jgi:hypothetical protein
LPSEKGPIPSRGLVQNFCSLTAGGLNAVPCFWIHYSYHDAYVAIQKHSPHGKDIVITRNEVSASIEVGLDRWYIVAVNCFQIPGIGEGDFVWSNPHNITISEMRRCVSGQSKKLRGGLLLPWTWSAFRSFAW